MRKLITRESPQTLIDAYMNNPVFHSVVTKHENSGSTYTAMLEDAIAILANDTVSRNDSLGAQMTTKNDVPSRAVVRPWWQNSKVLRMLFPPTVQPGDVMVFDDKSTNPFKDPPHRVVVKATQGDWVSYCREEGSMWQNESLKRSSFAFCYVKA